MKAFYQLLYADKNKVNTLPGSDEPFTLRRYKEEIDKPYSRITFYLCSSSDYFDSVLGHPFLSPRRHHPHPRPHTASDDPRTRGNIRPQADSPASKKSRTPSNSKPETTRPPRNRGAVQTSPATMRAHKIPRYICTSFAHSRPQRPRSFWSAPRIATSGPLADSNPFLSLIGQM